MREYMKGLIGTELKTPVERRPNWVVSVGKKQVFVSTWGNEEGSGVPIAFVQDVVDRVFEGEEVVFDPKKRSAFVGAVLATMDEVEVLNEPRRARLREGGSKRNPDWEADELILALDLYLRWRPKQPPAGHADLEELSELLRELPIHPPEVRGDDFRNVNSVRRKLGDFTAPDPDYSGTATKGGAGVHVVWERFAQRPSDLAIAVGRITESTTEGGSVTFEEGEEAAVEGRVVYREHRRRERDPGLVRRKKESVLRKNKHLACEACGFDFSKRYGDLGEGFIECHHLVPLATSGERETRLEELALVCSNCHRMIHRMASGSSLDEFKAHIRLSD